MIWLKKQLNLQEHLCLSLVRSATKSDRYIVMTMATNTVEYAGKG